MRGLSHAHSRGIIHRDIKPQNIMVLRDGSVKVADFGIACLANASQTLTQEALGSVHYISPEQARGDRIDARSDIYSAGVVLYEMLTGRLPFEGDSAVSVAIQHLSSVPLAPRDIDHSIPEPLELICMKAMNSDPRQSAIPRRTPCWRIWRSSARTPPWIWTTSARNWHRCSRTTSPPCPFPPRRWPPP